VDLAAEFAKRWPGATVDASRIDSRGGDIVRTEATHVDGDHRDDVILATACLAGVEPALTELETNVLAPALANVRARRLGDIDEVAQLARVRLLVGDAPGLASYRGRGSLAAFVRTIVMRIALDQVRATRDVSSDLESLVDRVGADPEIAHMRERYAGDLGAALQTAWRALAAHDRFVLDLELHQHLGIEQIASIYGIHRTNATRRIASARAAFVSATRDALRAKLGIGDPTLDSILRLMTTSARWTALAAIEA
jgi:RNA polymerase sigma-70 factor (ECF subfamily)